LGVGAWLDRKKERVTKGNQRAVASEGPSREKEKVATAILAQAKTKNTWRWSGPPGRRTAIFRLVRGGKR